MGSFERVVTVMESRALSVWVTKHFVIIFAKHVIIHLIDSIQQL